MPTGDTPHATDRATPDPERLLPPPSELRPALAEALRRVRILRGLLRLSEQVAERSPRPTPTGDRPAEAVRS